MSAERLWTMLTARGSTIGVAGRDYSGMTAEDVRGAAQGMKRGPFLAAMVIRCGDLNTLWDLRHHLHKAILAISNLERWQAHKGTGRGRIDTLMGNLVILEHIYGRVCPVCFGYRHLNRDVQPILCDTCSGRGKVKLRDQDKAVYCDMTRENWSRFWSKRYNVCYQVVDDWVQTADRHLKRNLRQEVVEIDTYPQEVV